MINICGVKIRIMPLFEKKYLRSAKNGCNFATANGKQRH